MAMAGALKLQVQDNQVCSLENQKYAKMALCKYY